MAQFESLVGKTITQITVDNGGCEVNIETSDGLKYRMFHYQSCCENVSVEEIVGDLEDIKNSPILLAEESITHNDEAPVPANLYDESYTWTFYKLSTIKGSVTIRWYGSSNGYYSERVDFEQLK